MWRSRIRSRSTRRFIVSGIGLVLLFIGYLDLPQVHSNILCLENVFADNIVVAVKTGATEAAEKIPILMQTSLRCANHVLFFSDLEQDIGRYHLYDALEAVLPSVQKSDPAFQFYREQQKTWDREHDVSAMKGTRFRQNSSESWNELSAWTLDKYKNMHLLEKTWNLKPDMDWYVLIDADTYIVWANLLRWLPSFNPAEKWWFGAQINIDGIPFSHGGSGTVLSKSTVRDFVVTRPGTAARWDPMIHQSCCGDHMLGKALHEYGIPLTNMRPSISGQSPSSIPVLDHYWCQPIITMHHISPTEMLEIDDFERGRLDQSLPLNHADIFSKFIKEALLSMPSPQPDWDNRSWKLEAGSGTTLENVAHERLASHSFDDCTALCESIPDCLQYLYYDDTCYVGKAFRLGARKEPDEDEHGQRWVSGWHRGRILEWIGRQPGCERREFPEVRKAEVPSFGKMPKGVPGEI